MPPVNGIAFIQASLDSIWAVDVEPHPHQPATRSRLPCYGAQADQRRQYLPATTTATRPTSLAADCRSSCPSCSRAPRCATGSTVAIV